MTICFSCRRTLASCERISVMCSSSAIEWSISWPFSRCSARPPNTPAAPTSANMQSTSAMAPSIRVRIVKPRSRDRVFMVRAPFSGRSMPRAAHEGADVQDQRDAAVAHDRGARDVLDLAVVALEVLHNHLLLAEQFVHQQRDAAAFGLDDDHDVAGALEV